MILDNLLRKIGLERVSSDADLNVLIGSLMRLLSGIFGGADLDTFLIAGFECHSFCGFEGLHS